MTVRRSGTPRDADHHRLAFWAADCAWHVLHLFEQERPGDDRPRRAIELARAWARGELTMTRARGAASAIRAARAAVPEGERAGRLECAWQRARLPGEVRELVLDDQRLRNGVCWYAFDC